MSGGHSSIPALSFRSRKVLYATITDYISTGVPVGSRRLSKQYGIELSPASIRNVLADLEEAGYLTQPHASAGRVPTEAGFRMFVDALMNMQQLTTEPRLLPNERDQIVQRLRASSGDKDQLLREVGDLLSVMSDAAGVVLANVKCEHAAAKAC